MTPNDLKNRTAQFKIEMERALNDDLPKIIGNRIVKMTKQNFVEEGYFGRKWKDVKRRTHPPKHGKHPADARRAILTGRTGNLKRSIKARPEKGSVTIYSDADYAVYHNEGTRHIPQRQFLGKHPAVIQRTREVIMKELARIAKGLTH